MSVLTTGSTDIKEKILRLILSFLHLFSFPNHPLIANVSVGLPPRPCKFDANTLMKKSSERGERFSVSLY